MIGTLVFLLLLAIGLWFWAVFQLLHLGPPAETDEDDELDAQEEALRIEWDAVDKCRQVDDLYFAARDAMRQAEAESRPRQSWPPVVDGEVVDVRVYPPDGDRGHRT